MGAGVCIEWPGRRGGAARREAHARRGRGVGASAAAAAGVVTMRVRRAVCARVESERCEGCRRRCRPSNTGRRGLCRLGAMRRQGDAGRAGLSATGPGCCAAAPWWLCVVACGRAHVHVPVRWEESALPLSADMFPSSSSPELARLSRSVSKPIRVSTPPNGSWRGESAVVRCGWSSVVSWGPTLMLVKRRKPRMDHNDRDT